MNATPLKVMTIVGTRPEIIRLSRVMAALDASPAIAHTLVHTGQNYDYTLNQIFFDQMGIRSPDRFLDVPTDSLGQTLGHIIWHAEKALLEVKPDALLVLGDTNSALAAITAKRLHIPIYHMEAGNRCFDANVPEEINRKIIDHIADFNLVYTEHARRHLLSEGLEHRRIYLTGSPMCEVLEHYRPQIAASKVLGEMKLKAEGYVVASLHRQENVDSKERLTSLMHTLEQVARTWNIPVIVSTHPRTAKRLETFGISTDKALDIRLIEPLGFFDYVHLQQHAFCTLSDSGTIAEEAAIMGFPAVTLRNAIERPEALDTGSIMIAGLDQDTILHAINTVRARRAVPHHIPADYQIEDSSQRVLQLILGTAKLHANWSNLHTG